MRVTVGEGWVQAYQPQQLLDLPLLLLAPS